VALLLIEVHRLNQTLQQAQLVFAIEDLEILRQVGVRGELLAVFYYGGDLYQQSGGRDAPPYRPADGHHPIEVHRLNQTLQQAQLVFAIEDLEILRQVGVQMVRAWCTVSPGC
jgi:hypothetical protein